MRISAIAVAAMVVVLPWTGTSKAVLPSLDPNSRELIVKFHGSGDDVIFPEEALDVVTNVSDPARNYLSPVDWALYTRLGSPVSARWLIELRLDDEYIVEIEKLDPDHPESRLQGFVILRYSDAGSQAVARERLLSDASVSSVVTNSKGTYSLRVNDYYVAVTGAGQIPGGYQWALEDIGAMSPWTNPTAQSAWDKATGFGYVAIVDSGIMRAHPDLQQNFKAHFPRHSTREGATEALSKWTNPAVWEPTAQTPTVAMERTWLGSLPRRRTTLSGSPGCVGIARLSLPRPSRVMRSSPQIGSAHSTMRWFGGRRS